MIARAIATLLTACALASAAHADTSYTVFTPTVEPYQRFENHVAPGAFTDSFNFTLDQSASGYVWLFPRVDAWFGFNQVEDTQGVTLTLVNNDTEKQWNGVLYPTVSGNVSWLTPGVLPMVISGFDPNKSLYLSGDFAAGHYSAFVSGLATGSAGSSYIAKFSVSNPVPEAGTASMLLVGLGGLAWVARRRPAKA